MEGIAKTFAIGMPVFAVLIIFEKIYGYLKGNDTVPWIDGISSSYSGITFIIRILLGFGIPIVSYEYMVQHLAIIHIKTTWLLYGVTFVVMDFQGYWGHRFAHIINFFWNRHLIHHSSEEYNLACALRQSISDIVKFFFFLSIPAALLGISPTVIAIIFPIHSFSQYWYHTRLIGKLGFLEHIIVTPSHHRVHHALNPIYLDKNYSPIFIVWDHLFGTFQEELESEPPVFGITRPSRTWNPIVINFEHLILMIKDAWRAENWVDKITIWIRPTGWRPHGFEEKYPVTKINDPYDFEKYNPSYSKSQLIWINIQFFTLFFFIIYEFQHIAQIGMNGLYFLASFVFVQVYSATEFMNKNKWAPLYSIISTVISLAIYTLDNTWLGTDKISSMFPIVFLVYIIIQPFVIFSLTKTEEKYNTSNMQRA